MLKSPKLISDDEHPTDGALFPALGLATESEGVF